MSRANLSGNRLKVIAVVYGRLTNSSATRGSPSGGRFCCQRKQGVASMEEYNFWRDLFDTFQSLSDWIKALWLIVLPAFVLGLIALILRHRVAVKAIEHAIRGELIYTIRRDANGQLHVSRHGAALEREPALVLLEQANSGDGTP